jgi:glycosyltransferase involved in cell wall biosynthesis
MAVTGNRVVAVVIGRNESKSLQLSLGSIQSLGLPVVYADSGSGDDSPGIAKRLGAEVVELSSDRPFSAARGRNEGLALALTRWPEAEFVMYLDGDCTLHSAFPEAAMDEFDRDAKLAIVTGHLTERNPQASLYNRLCSIEWRSPAGRIENMNGLGGIMMARVAALREVDGFNEIAIAGEEPDLGARLSLAGWKLLKIDCPIATHDADMMHFGQWWRRAVRGGHAIAHRYDRHGTSPMRDGRREVLSDLFWGLVLPLSAIILLWPSHGISLLLLAGYGLLYQRVLRHYRETGLSLEDARLVSRFTIYSKFAHVVGIVRYLRARLSGQYRIIDWR